ERANGRLRATGYPSVLIQDATFDYAVDTVEGNWISEVEIAAGLDYRQVHAWRPGIGDDVLYPGDGEIAPRLHDLAWLQINDPVANTSLDPPKILRRELISLG